MSPYDRYSDPYGEEPASYDTLQPDAPPPFEHQPANGSSSYPGPLRNSAYQSGQIPTGYQHNPSSEKMVEDGSYGQNTERAQPGRQGLHKPARSWAEIGPPPRSTGILRMWRKDERGRQWFRGGGLRSSLRICFCCVTVTIIMIVSIVLAILLYIRPPSVALESINLGSSPVALTSGGLTISFDLGISVTNPNWFNVNFKEISAVAKYPVGSYQSNFGGGTLYNVDFKGYTQSTFDFPLTLNYTLADDPNKTILNDLAAKCGLDGGAAGDITIDYDLYLKLRVIGIGISPTISNKATFTCPISASDIASIEGHL